jgi:hypothetical protein
MIECLHSHYICKTYRPFSTCEKNCLHKLIFCFVSLFDSIFLEKVLLEMV